MLPEGDIKFNDGTEEFGAPPSRPQGSDFAGMLIKWGVAKDRQQAQMVMMIVLGLALLGAVYFMFFSGGTDVPSEPVF